MSAKENREKAVVAGQEQGMQRREFLRRTAVGAGAVAVTLLADGCRSEGPAPEAAAVAAEVPTGKAWKFGIMADSQWLSSDDGYNPNTSAIAIIQALNREFIAQDVKFVVHVGDHANRANKESDEAGYHTTPQLAEDTRALFAQPLYNAGIGFFPVRGNHDTAVAEEFRAIYPQTQNGQMNATPARLFNLHNPDAAKQPFPGKRGTTFTLGSGYGAIGSPSANLQGLSYGFDFDNARFLLIDQFLTADGKGPDGNDFDINTTAQLQQSWIDKALAGKPAGGHAFVFAHKGLITQKHQDILFGENPSSAAAPGLDPFIRSMYDNGARLYFCGHDHIHNRSLVSTIDGRPAKDGHTARVTHVLCQSDSSKFYTPNEQNAAGHGDVPPCTSNDAHYCGGKRQTQLSQELYAVGYYIVTVDGPNVTVDYHSAPVYPKFGKSGENLIVTTPALGFSKRETFGYSQVGKQFVLGNGDSFDKVQDTGPSGTLAKILGGTNSNPVTDQSGRKYYNDVNTGWLPATDGTSSDILALWGMNCSLGSEQTDVYVLSLSYRPTKGAVPVLATTDGAGNWVNAVAQNLGGSKKRHAGPWQPGYPLGSYGVDTESKTVWAVVNFNGYFAAVAGV